MTVLAFDTERTTNAQAIVDCVRLGYLSFDDRVLDATYGEGAFWTIWRPSVLGMNDLDPDKGNLHYDFTDLPFADRSWDVVVFDPPYKLNGTPNGGGPASSDGRYGVSTPTRWQDRIELILSGVRDCARVADRRLLVKVQDQVCSGRIRWQTHMVLNDLTWRLVDELYVYGMREQPESIPCKTCAGLGVWPQSDGTEATCSVCNGGGRTPRKQRHAARNYSTLMVFGR